MPSTIAEFRAAKCQRCGLANIYQEWTDQEMLLEIENEHPFNLCEECENDVWTERTDEPWEPTKIPPRPWGIEVHAGYIYVGSIHDGVVTQIAFTFRLADKSRAQTLVDDMNRHKPRS